MPGISRVGIDKADTGLINSNGQSFVKVENAFWAIVGDGIASHGSSPHDAATINQGSTFVKINGVAASLAGNTATCGHILTGSANFRVQF